jgi:hypothetical protein
VLFKYSWGGGREQATAAWQIAGSLWNTLRPRDQPADAAHDQTESTRAEQDGKCQRLRHLQEPNPALLKVSGSAQRQSTSEHRRNAGHADPGPNVAPWQTAAFLRRLIGIGGNGLRCIALICVASICALPQVLDSLAHLAEMKAK